MTQAATKGEAICDIIREAQCNVRTKAGLARVNCAFRMLGLTNGECETVLQRLDYLSPSGEPYPIGKPRR